MIRFRYTILYVPDVDRALSFYEAAFVFQRKFITPDKAYGELQTGETILSFAEEAFAAANLKDGFSASDPGLPPFAMEIGFTTDDVAGTYAAAIAAGAQPEAAPAFKPH